MSSPLESNLVQAPVKSILLVLLHNLSNVTLSCDYFKHLFSTFGDVKKILIFEKNVPIKAFIEMSSEKEAVAAQNALNNTFLPNDQGKINVYLSELAELKLPQKNFKFAKDYTLCQSESSSPPLKEAELKQLVFSAQIPHSNQPRSLYTIPEVNEYRKYSENEKDSYNDSQNLERPPPGLEKSFKAFQMQKGIFLEKVGQSQGNCKSQKSAIIKTPSTSESMMFSPPLLEALSASLLGAKISNAGSALTKPLLWEENSKVLYVKGLSSKTISVHNIYNLFSNFGDIKRIILLRAKEVALVEFETLEYAKVARENLNNLCFFDEYMKISFSNYKEIIPKNISKHTVQEDLLICENVHNRFKNEKNLNINPPSQVLHLSNLEKNSCKEEIIQEFFKDVCEIDGVKFIFQDEFRNMCLVRFKRLEDALKAISIKHNGKLDGRKVKISFTKSKL